jgi:hypothetical protein
MRVLSLNQSSFVCENSRSDAVRNPLKKPRWLGGVHEEFRAPRRANADTEGKGAEELPGGIQPGGIEIHTCDGFG